MITYAQLEAAVSKPCPPTQSDIGSEEYFDPWNDLLPNVYAHYSATTEALFIDALHAVRDHTTFKLIDDKGTAGELVLYVLAGHGLTEYGTSPRGAWPAPNLEPLWEQLIAQWIAFYQVHWDEAYVHL